MTSKILLVAGARPNFMKIGPLMKALRKEPRFKPVLVHTGQHYDYKMSDVFFKQLGIPKPDIFLNAGSGSHAVQTAAVMSAFEPVMLKEKPALVVVVGDVNSTLACSLVAAKMNVKVAHVESGLRSFDRSMPEEINRLVTDAIADFLYVSEPSGLVNLKKEGADRKKVIFVGNIMIDTLVQQMPAINRSGALRALGLKPRTYAVATLHRPSNVDTKEALGQVLKIFRMVSKGFGIVWPIHPRTRQNLENLGLKKDFEALPNLKMIDPQGYIDFVRLVKESGFVLTDSGGIQEETTVLDIPCITMRENTERPSTLKEGTNLLVGRDLAKIEAAVRKIRAGAWRKTRVPKFWDGKTAGRIVKHLKESGI